MNSPLAPGPQLAAEREVVVLLMTASSASSGGAIPSRRNPVRPRRQEGGGTRRFFRRNGLTLVLAALFLGFFAGGQFLTGWSVYNEERRETGRSELGLAAYLGSAHFVEATAENWESEFLQMFVYVWATSFLFQRGSAESKDPDEAGATSPRPVAADSPWPVRRGGAWRAIYAHSLSLAFAVLFFVSFWLHLLGSARVENEERMLRGEAPATLGQHLGGARFWFESFQNWQSEFLAIGSMVVLSIFLRERGSPESKPLEAPHHETGA